MGLRLKLFLLSVALIVASVAVADVYLLGAVAAGRPQRVRSELDARASLVAAHAAASPAAADDRRAWDAFARQEARLAAGRVTVFAPDGDVAGDSETHAWVAGSEPEVSAALAGRRGWSERADGPSGATVSYVAAPFHRQGAVAGAVRVGLPADAEGTTAALRRLVLFASAAVVLLGLVFSGVASDRISASVRRLTAAAREMRAGQLDVHTGMSGGDDVAELGLALDRLSGSLSATMNELRAERGLHARILEGMQDGVLVVDATGRLELVNAALRGMLLVGADAVGKLVIEVVRHAGLQDLLERARTTGEVARGEIDLPGIKPRRLLVHIAPLSGAEEGLLAVFVDVTDLRRLETLRRDFVANVSHELSTPAIAVRDAVTTLRQAMPVDRRAAMTQVEIIERHAERLKDLIEDLLDLSRFESKEFRLKREPVDLDAVVHIVASRFHGRAAAKGVTLSARVEEGLPRLESDQRAVEQVLSNLVDNAVKYCPAGASVSVTIASEDQRVRMSVSDTGPGIAPQHLPRLFERFYRVDPDRSRALGGTGLGLSIVKHLVEAMGGTVSVESDVGRGTTFVIVLSGTRRVPGPGPSEPSVGAISP